MAARSSPVGGDGRAPADRSARMALADGAHRAGAADRVLPAAAAEGGLHRLELQARGQARALHALGGDLAVAEEALAQGHAAHLQALELAAARQPSPMMSSVLPPPMSTTRRWPGSLGMRVRDAGVDQARLLHAGDDLDRVAERLAGALEEGLLAVRDAQRVGADHAHAVGVHVAQALAEALEAGERARRHVLVDAAVLGARRPPGAPSRAGGR